MVSATVLLAVTIAIFLAIGLYHRKHIQSSDDYNVAGRRMGTWLVAASITATYMSTATYLGFTGVFYAVGIGTYAIAFAAGFALIIAAIWIIGPLRDYRAVTIPEFLGDRYDSHMARGFGSLLVFIITIGVAAAATQGLGLIVSDLTTLDYHTAIVVIMAVAVLYAMLGGLFTVYWTDALSLGVMLLVVLVGIPVLLLQAGTGSISSGYNAVFTGLPDGWLTWQGAGGVFGGPELTGQFILWALGGAVLPYVFTRGLGAKKKKAAKQGFALGFFLYTIVAIIPLAIVMASMRVLEPGIENPDRTFIVMALDYMPAGLGEFMLLTIFLAGISSIDSQLIVSAQSYAVDMYEHILNPDATAEQNVLVSRATTAVAGVAILAIAWLELSGIFWVAAFAVQLGAAGLFVPITAGIYWDKGTWQGAVACIIGGPAVIVAIDVLSVDLSWMGWFGHMVVPGVIVGTVLYFGISYATQSSVTEEGLDVYADLR